MKLDSLTYQIALILLVITAFYTLIYSGVTGLLLASSVALITAAFVEPFEAVAGITVFFALIYTLYLKRIMRRYEGFQDSPKVIQERIAKMAAHASPSKKAAGPQGVYSSAVEGFQDLQPEIPKEGASEKSTAAPAAATVIPQVNEQQVKSVTQAIQQHDAKKKSDQEIEKEEFQSATNELFKIGQMPSENAEGPKLDAGQTLMKAMNSLDPNTISAMTTDTKKLLETQKGLMTMLNQMRPVLADGKELLQTFSGMFGNGGGLKL